MRPLCRVAKQKSPVTVVVRTFSARRWRCDLSTVQTGAIRPHGQKSKKLGCNGAGVGCPYVFWRTKGCVLTLMACIDATHGEGNGAAIWCRGGDCCVLSRRWQCSAMHASSTNSFRALVGLIRKILMGGLGGRIIECFRGMRCKLKNLIAKNYLV